MYIHCVCGRKNQVTQGGGKRRCKCGALVWADDTRPWVRIPEDSLEERKGSGKPVILKRPARR